MDHTSNPSRPDHSISEAAGHIPTASVTLAPQPSHVRRWIQRGLVFVGLLLALWLVNAYIMAPMALRRALANHPALKRDIPKTTITPDGVPGDPLNVALIGTEEEVKEIMRLAGWKPPDPITLRSSAGIAGASILGKKYESAPMSQLKLWGKGQDLAFQFALKDARQRHHVRFWKSDDVDDAGRPMWVGAGTFDDRVALDINTGKFTHHIAPDIDTERNKIFEDLEKTGLLEITTLIENFHECAPGKERAEGCNGCGHPYYTDGHLMVGLIRLKD